MALETVCSNSVGLILVRPALQDKPGRTRGVSEPSLAKNLPKPKVLLLGLWPRTPDSQIQLGESKAHGQIGSPGTMILGGVGGREPSSSSSCLHTNRCHFRRVSFQLAGVVACIFLLA